MEWAIKTGGSLNWVSWEVIVEELLELLSVPAVVDKRKAVSDPLVPRWFGSLTLVA